MLGDQKMEKEKASHAIAKLSSKGQIVIPDDIRRRMKLEQGDYFYVTGYGKTIILTKVERTPFEEITSIFQRLAQEKGVTREEIEHLVEEERTRKWQEKYEKGA